MLVTIPDFAKSGMVAPALSSSFPKDWKPNLVFFWIWIGEKKTSIKCCA